MPELADLRASRIASDLYGDDIRILRADGTLGSGREHVRARVLDVFQRCAQSESIHLIRREGGGVLPELLSGRFLTMAPMGFIPALRKLFCFDHEDIADACADAWVRLNLVTGGEHRWTSTMTTRMLCLKTRKTSDLYYGGSHTIPEPEYRLECVLFYILQQVGFGTVAYAQGTDLRAVMCPEKASWSESSRVGSAIFPSGRYHQNNWRLTNPSLSYSGIPVCWRGHINSREQD